MKTSFAVSAVLWTGAYLVSNYTGLVPAVTGWVAPAPKQSEIQLLGQLQNGFVVVQTAPGQPQRVMSVQDYQTLVASKIPLSSDQPGKMRTAMFLGGLLGIYFITGFSAISEWHRRPFLRLGNYTAARGPGLVWVDPILHTALSDYSIQDFVSKLEIDEVQSHDNVPLKITALLTYSYIPERIRDAVVNVQSAWKSTEKRTSAAIARAVAGAELDTILHERGKLQVEISSSVQAMVNQWGIHIVAVEIKDVKITDEGIQQAIAMRARASKEAEAELVRARMQSQIAQELNHAAKSYNADGRWLKQIETLLEMTRSAENNTVLLPSELMTILGRGPAD